MRVASLLTGLTGLAGLAVLATAPLAAARGADNVITQIDLARGTAKKVDAPVLPPAKLVTPPPPLQAIGARYDQKGMVTVTDASGKPLLALQVGKLQYEWMPWSIVQPGVVIFDWRERILNGTRPDTYRDVVRGIDLASGTELWRRDTVGAAATAIGDKLILLAIGGQPLELVDSRRGTTVGHPAIAGTGTNAIALEGGDTLVDTGETLARFDGKGALRWQVEALGVVLSVTPLMQPAARFRLDFRGLSGALPATGEYLVLASTHLARLDAATGKVRWMQPSSSTSLLVDAGRVLVTDLAVDAKRVAKVALVVRDLATGAATREIELLRSQQFFDSATATVLAVDGTAVEVSTTFIVLD